MQKFFAGLGLLTMIGLTGSVQAREACTYEPTVLVHGGAGDVSDAAIPNKKLGVKLAARKGFEILRYTGSVLDAVEAAVNSLEADPNFNAGYGSVLNWDGEVEMDAAIMNGADLSAGCVSLARDIINPISLARRIMESTKHRYIAGPGAMRIAEQEGFNLLPPGALITEAAIKALQDYKNSLNATQTQKGVVYGSPGTVGAVAIDACGNVAAATSTGGLTGKLPGRIGDSPILGGGTYADNESGAVSATGHGETIMRYNVVARMLALVEHGNYTAQEAAVQVLEQMTQRFNETAGIIAVDYRGQLGIYFTSNRMSWAYQRGNQVHFGVDAGEDEIEFGEPRTTDN
ncbi:probable isoaspartyl peptidase/L-asparaginase GA20639 [Scaptodrosophila lebanonensis]|uniref:Probable isoaspartyl peptidase/L-asparaginase GA20639 n=1 Tax=Drosophila lebanonensis TaxID=7225 RepID=A0A6J2TNT7_DROLE|nr:probable isoaspartyl peptidase/L-asparaginase GA20639 [Scaptodrosophila lebanonensis]